MLMTLRATAILLSTVLVLPAASRINDPKSFVTEVYQRMMAASNDHPYAPPEDIYYTARLRKLFHADNASLSPCPAAGGTAARGTGPNRGSGVSSTSTAPVAPLAQIGRASCRERV